jgi:myo-inositol-1(or 4)-monophosphatase
MAAACPLPLSRLRQLGAQAAAAARGVGATIARRHGRMRPRDVHRKGEGDFVTTADRRAEQWLRRRLLRALPGAGFLGEETAAADITAEFVWVVDPIDGTSNFARGLPHYGVSIALVHCGRPILAALWCEPESCLYTAIAGRGACRSGKRVRIPAGFADDRAILGCQWYRGQQELGFLARAQRHGGRIRTFGSTIVQLTDVVMGRLDANIQQQGRVWDIAAAGLLVLEAGGRFTDWQGKNVFPLARLDIGHTSTIAAPPRLHPRIVRWLRV